MSLFTKTTTFHLDIQGMTCQNCVKHVTEALESVPGVKQAQVDLEAAHAEVQAKADADTADMVAAVEEAGYQATRSA